MTYQDLKTHYPKFSYDSYSYTYSCNDLNLVFHYSISDLHFTHNTVYKNVPIANDLDNFVFNIGLSEMFSYWKLTCSPLVEISAGNLTPSQISFWHKLFIKGMGEYFYKNQIDFTKEDFVKISSINNAPLPPPLNLRGGPKVIVPVGGGKDSIVTLELLKSQYEVVPFIVNPAPVILKVCQTAGLSPLIVHRELDPQISQLNSQGFLNGHVPISAMYAFTSLLAAHLTNSAYVAFSNERSTSESNVTYLNHEINHQYSKTLEFETDLNAYLNDSSVKIFSFLRPLYELQITKLFSRYPQYFPIFSSCNQNFMLNNSLSEVWCCHCPKCISTALMLSCFISKAEVTKIMGSYPPDLPKNQATLNQLLGQDAVKPFECVLTRAEANAAYSGQDLDEILICWQDNLNLPNQFTKILKSNL